MAWFDEQIRKRKLSDDEVFNESFANLAGAVISNRFSNAMKDDLQATRDAFEAILKYFRIRKREIPDQVKNPDEQLEYLMRPYGIMRREIALKKGWYKDAFGAMLGVRKDDGSLVALIPTGLVGYSFIDHKTGKRVKVNKKTEDLLEEDAMIFYKPFPLKSIGVRDLIFYMVHTLRAADFILYIAALAVVTLLGMLLPRLNYVIFSNIVVSGNLRVVIAMAVFMIGVSLSSLLFSTIESLLLGRINTRIDIAVESATMMRIFSLKAEFFKEYSAGDLSNRSSYVGTFCQTLIANVMSTGLTSIFSLVYISQIFIYAPALVIPSLIIIFVTVGVTLLTTFVQMRISKRQMELSAQESGMTYSLLSGIQKIKLAGAEKRMFARWANLYSQSAKLTYNPPTFIKINSVITTAISLAGTLALYAAALFSHISVADYYAFNTAYGYVSGAFMGMAALAVSMAQIQPILGMIKPIMDAEPEVSEGKEMITRLSGAVEINNVSFRYSETMPLVLNDFSLKIAPKQYVAIVGATGCGKSTLMRLLLGFETPQKGAVYYDGKDLTRVDLKSLRSHVGVVMQNSSLFQGDIFSNITISAPELTLDDAWRAAEIAGIADDIRSMPMGMNTVISEGQGGISGGQRQRLMIARAIAPNPKILMLDEATSALDNITQKQVSDALAELDCTRIVIAHRLSTIRQCDRILVLQDGGIVEDGTYDELIALGGYFAELVERQRLDAGEETGEE